LTNFISEQTGKKSFARNLVRDIASATEQLSAMGKSARFVEAGKAVNDSNATALDKPSDVMIKACCTFCKWTERATGVYNTHHRARLHLQAEHPTDFAVMKAGEIHLRRTQTQLVEKFGQAVLPLNMNRSE
jgi:hypothetical protein